MKRPQLRSSLRRHSPRKPALVAIAAGLGILVVGAIIASATPPPAPPAPAFTTASGWTLLDLQRHLAAGDVAAVTATASMGRTEAGLVAKLKDGSLVDVRLTVPAGEAAGALAALGYGGALTEEAWTAARTPTQAPPQDPLRSLASTVVTLAIALALLVAVYLLFRNGLPGRRQSASFATVRPGAATAAGSAPGSASGAPAIPGVTLASVAGCDEAKAELVEVVEFLREPERFARLGATLPRGVLLYGPPGTGKTLLAKAVAAEAAVAFIHVSGSEFVEKYVGVGARRVRDLFAQARQLGRAVVFVDEFDALAKARGGPNGHEEREQTLNQLLVELDGFAPNDNIVVIAATNRLDVLDPAVLRPGRFNRKIHVGLPDVRGRREILAVHARSKPLEAEVDLGVLARKTYGFSGAQLADLLNESAILAARRAAESISSADVQGGWLKVAVGTGRRRSMDERERAIIAAHEVGHAICGRVHGDRRRVEEISLFAHGEALGVTVSSQEDNDLPSESDLRSRLVALMGGRAAEELLFQEVTGGASNDFEKATQIATTMVTRFGMGVDPDAAERGPSGRGVLSLIVPRSGSNLPSEVQPAATRAIRAILDAAYTEACETLAAHLPTLRRIAAYLVEEERVDGETFDALFDGSLEVPTADDEWRPAAARPRDWADVVPYRDRRFRRAAEPRDDDAAPAGGSGPAPHPVPVPVPDADPVPVAAVTGPDDDPVAPAAATLADAASDAVADSVLAADPVAAVAPGSPVVPAAPLAPMAFGEPLAAREPAPTGGPTPNPTAAPTAEDGERRTPLRARSRFVRRRPAPTISRHPRLRRRIRSAAAGWLRDAAVRIGPSDPPPDARAGAG